jgi:RNA polymerase sigma factor (sigma-70 family)
MHVTNQKKIKTRMPHQLESTFLEAVEQNKHRLLRVCSVYAEDDDDKKDLFQEALIHIWQSLPSFEGRSSLSTWMFRITLNVCLRLQSKQSKKKSRFVKMDSIQIAHANDDDANSQEQERLVKLRSCIKKLNDADKAVITLYLEELSYTEISNITGLTENHVAVKVKRIKSKLLNCITEKS